MADSRDFQIKDYIQQPIILNSNNPFKSMYDDINRRKYYNDLLDKIKTFSTLAVLLDNKQFKEIFDKYFEEYL